MLVFMIVYCELSSFSAESRLTDSVCLSIMFFWFLAPCGLVRTCGCFGKHAVSMKMAVFWLVAPCSLVEFYRCFRGACSYLHHQGDLIMKVESASATSVKFYQTTRRNNTGHSRLRENLNLIPSPSSGLKYYILSPEEDRMFPWNGGICREIHTGQRPRRTSSSPHENHEYREYAFWFQHFPVFCH
jgi:hypothetical protein